MGLFAEKAKKLNHDQFKPLELTEGNVMTIFNRCLATEDTTDYLKSILYQKEWGHAEDSNPILFDKKKVVNNLKTIRYLYGQLLTTHKHSNTINTSKESPHNSMTNYKGEIWTDKQGIIMQFFHLGVVTNTIYPFNPNGNSIFQNIGIQPTLSPNDPDFAEWWEAHKGEWEG